MFSTIILGDGSKICIHHPQLDEPEYVSFIDYNQYNFSNLINLQKILRNSPIGIIDRIYLLANINDFQGYGDIIQYYKSITTNLIRIDSGENGNIIIDDNNEIIKIE